MNPKRLPIEKSLPAAVLIALLTLGFCIFTDNQGVFRKYADADIPLVYQVHESAPPEWRAGIKAGADAWTSEPSNYFEFEEGPPTSVTAVAQDGVNLVFFDTEGVNFPPNTNAIAFSSTFTTNSGGFRAVESDLIWNARDFPPGTNGEPDRQDLQAVMAHEFGHHMGIAHTGPVGGPPGCGPLLPAATMFGTSANGDTTGRSLEPDDKAAGAVMYPVWVLTGLILDAETTQPLAGAGIVTDEGAAGSFTGPHEAVPGSNNRSQRPGVVGVIPAGEDGTYSAVFLQDHSALAIEFFGYETVLDEVQFAPPGGIGNTETIQKNFLLQKSPRATLSGMVVDSLTRAPVRAELEVLAISNKVGTPDTAFARVATTNGAYAVELPVAEDYLVTVHPEIPYPTVRFNITNLDPGGATRDVELHPAQVFIVNDDSVADNQRYLEETLDALGIRYFSWQTTRDSTPDAATYGLFPEPRTVFWQTGATADPLSEEERQSLTTFLDSGGHLVLSGANIAESDTGSALLADYLQVSFAGNFAPPILRGIAGDPVGDGLVLRTSAGPGNSTSKDILTTGAEAVTAIGYGPTGASGAAAVRITGSENNWRAVFLGFGIETVENTEGVRDILVNNILHWFTVITGIEDRNEGTTDSNPPTFALSQNYPNPFNPATTIRVEVARSSRVTITIFNSLGQEVRRLTDRIYPPGIYELVWDGRDETNRRLASGVYFYRLQTSTGFRAVRKMMLIR